VLHCPPPINEEFPQAKLKKPPPIVEKVPLVVVALQYPPKIDEQPPQAVLAPPPIVDISPKATL
jgi:hypothetical protein